MMQTSQAAQTRHVQVQVPVHVPVAVEVPVYVPYYYDVYVNNRQPPTYHEMDHRQPQKKIVYVEESSDTESSDSEPEFQVKYVWPTQTQISHQQVLNTAPQQGVVTKQVVPQTQIRVPERVPERVERQPSNNFAVTPTFNPSDYLQPKDNIGYSSRPGSKNPSQGSLGSNNRQVQPPAITVNRQPSLQDPQQNSYYNRLQQPTVQNPLAQTTLQTPNYRQPNNRTNNQVVQPSSQPAMTRSLFPNNNSNPTPQKDPHQTTSHIRYEPLANNPRTPVEDPLRSRAPAPPSLSHPTVFDVNIQPLKDGDYDTFELVEKKNNLQRPQTITSIRYQVPPLER